jgi:uncharacterized protein YcbK (DUF882 family)
VSTRTSIGLALLAALGSATLQTPTGADARIPHTAGLATKKASDAEDETPPPPLLSTLVQAHTGERVVLDQQSPSAERFDALLADRVTGASHPLDAHLLDLLRAIAARHPDARIELVSGYRSAKLNEMLRKKGHHVASHSQHSLGHAVDFRIVPDTATRGIDPRALEKEIRKLGWEGGVGTYPTPGDWFVHADVGPNRHWVN